MSHPTLSDFCLHLFTEHFLQTTLLVMLQLPASPDRCRTGTDWHLLPSRFLNLHSFHLFSVTFLFVFLLSPLTCCCSPKGLILSESRFCFYTLPTTLVLTLPITTISAPDSRHLSTLLVSIDFAAIRMPCSHSFQREPATLQSKQDSPKSHVSPFSVHST